nr:ice-binding family protein [Modestobacter muralis]
MAGGGITNTGATTVSGDIGSFATTSIDGGITLDPGTDHGGDTVTQDAKTALTAALVAAADAGPKTPVTAGLLGGQLLSPGVYNSGSDLDLTGVLTLDGGGSYDSVFVLQAGSSLTTATSSTVVLTGGAQACNVFWQVGDAATLGSYSTFVGTLLADQEAITLGTGATVEGRVLASVAAVTLDDNTISLPEPCRTGSVAPVVDAPPTTTPPTATPTATPPPLAGATSGAPAPTPTAAGTPSSTASAPGPERGTGDSGRTTFGQVGRVPVGSVDTGDGSTS